MAAPQLDWGTIQQLMWSSDDEFEVSVSGLNMRALLDLVTALQNAMAEEQHHFDQLSLQLQLHPDSEDAEHKKISSSLCASQMRLARLCTRNMRCFTQQAIRAKKDQWMITRCPKEDPDPPLVTVQAMASSSPYSQENGDHTPSNGFRDSLRFFQAQLKKSPSSPNKSDLPIGPSLHRDTDSVLPNGIQEFDPKSSSSVVDSIPIGAKLPSNPQVPNICIDKLRTPSKNQDNLSLPSLSHPSETCLDSMPSIALSEEDSVQCVDRKTECESDLDSQDFVVHKNTFEEQEADLLSEDAYSSLNEDYDNTEETTAEPDIPSPDYGTSDEDEEEEFHVHHSRQRNNFDSEHDDDDFVDNSAAYMADPRRYIYYPEDKELEVIPEEDEDVDDSSIEGDRSKDIEDIDDEDESNCSPIEEVLGMPLPTDVGCEDDAMKTSQTECDSGVTDDQRSSTAEECDIEDGEEDYDRHSSSLGDTDSAKGSLHPDSCSESPTYMEKQAHHSTMEPHFLRSSCYSQERLPDGYLNGPGSFFTNGDSSSPFVDFDKNSLDDEFKTIDMPSNMDNGDYFSQHQNHTDKYNDRNGIDLDMRQPRNSTLAWNPIDLLKELYKVEYSEETIERTNVGYINMEGYLEKLPTGRKKATYWNPWKTRYFKTRNGFLYCYENSHSEKPTVTMQLMGGNILTMENNMIGIDDMKGHYIVVKCNNMDDADSWIEALQSQCRENFFMTYIQPVRYPLKSHKDVVIIDLGSCSIRAGILMDQPTLPQVFFPTVCATDKNSSSKLTFGVEALHPNVRWNSSLSFPVLPSAKVTKYTMDVETLPGLLKKIFQELNVDPRHYKVQLCVPRSFSLQTQIRVARILLEDFHVQAINLTHQAILCLYAYNASSGIVVDIGDRLDILPIIDGYIVESGVTRLPYGGQRIVHHLKQALSQKHISLISDVESYLVRYALEQLCYIAEDYKQEIRKFRNDPDSVEASVNVQEFFQEDCPVEEIVLDCGRFQAPEGLFSPDLWGLDNPGIHKLIYRAIQECSMDIRKEMARSIYLSGGVTLIPGLQERIEKELDKMLPSKVTPKIHASPYRYHMAYLGACHLASSPSFDEVCITLEEWNKCGNECLEKWHI